MKRASRLPAKKNEPLPSATRVLPGGKQPDDRRLAPLKDLNGYFPFVPPASREAWERRAAHVRRQILVALGLWPMPTPAPLKPVIHGRRDQGDYTVEKVYFESFAGLFVTGSLYRPKGTSGKRPGVLCPHGHWPNGRFNDTGLDEVRKQIVEGAERFENGGRSPQQARCVQLARMGCVVFHFDMLGYADSVQISHDLAHRFSKQRPAMNTARRWGLFSPAAELHLQSVMGLQIYNALRALDFLADLADVDPKRLAVTGASGGGTQTFILSAIDPRVAVSIPAVMVSTAMQGGCTCENASLLRVGTGNVEFAALFAPKPLCMTAADDWTKEMATKGFPQLKALYGLLGSEQNVELHPLIHFGHNYNYVSRARMYACINRHFGLGLPEPIVEEDYPRLTAADLTVWDEQHPAPASGDNMERDLLQAWTADTERQLAALVPGDTATLTSFRRLVGGAVDVLLGARIPPADAVRFDQIAGQEHGAYRLHTGLLCNTVEGSALPLIVLAPPTAASRTAIWLSPDGKRGLFTTDGQVQPALARLLKAGVTVIGVDLLYQGEFLADGKPLATTRRVDNPRESAAFTFGYSRAVFAQRVSDVLTVVRFALSRDPDAEVDLIGLDGAGHWASAALAQADGLIARAAIDTAGFRFAKVLDIHAPDFLPGGAKYFDLPGMLALGAPTPLWLAGEGGHTSKVVVAAYQAAGGRRALTVTKATASRRTDEAVTWLLGSSVRIGDANASHPW